MIIPKDLKDLKDLKEFRLLQWRCADGRVYPIGKLTDSHIANIIKWVHDHPSWYPDWVSKFFKLEAESRKLTEKFLQSSPIPWQDTDGKWKRLENNATQYEIIGR